MRGLVGLVLVGVLVSAGEARAGIVNVQSALSTSADEGVSGSVTGTADWRTGNTNLLVLGAAAVVRYRRGDHLWLGIAKGDLGKSNGARIIAKTFAHLRYRYRFDRLVLGEVFAQHELDQFRRLATRALVGAGPMFDLVDRKNLSVGLGVAYMLEYEKLRNDGAIDAGQSDVQHRLSSYVTAHYQLDDHLELVETAYAQPRLTDAADYRLLSDSQLVVKVNSKISLSTTFSVAFDNRPPATIKKTDTALKSAVSVSF